MPVNLIILQIASIFLFAAVLSIIARILRQPLLVAYIATGALLGYLGAFSLVDGEVFHVFSDLGIMFLLFLVGLEINYSSLRLVGRASLIIGLGQIIVTTILGYFIALAFDFGTLAALYTAAALTFSSTIIIVKLLSEKKDLGSLYGKITIGVMLLQDAFAILLLVILSGFHPSAGINWMGALLTLAKATALFVSMFWLGRNIFPKLFDHFGRSQELLFLVSTAWVFLIAAFAGRLGFSIEIGGLLAGISLANSSQHLAIGSRIKPLRDFFILLFFVILGSSLVGMSFEGLALPIIIFSLFVLIGTPLIVLAIMGFLGYRKSTSFLVGVMTAQVSEFSLILVALGARLEHIDQSILALVTAVAVITILLSTYMVTHADNLMRLRYIRRILTFFERKHLVENSVPEGGFHRPIILVGAHRTGMGIAAHIAREELLIIDFDPDVCRDWRARGYATLLGSLSDEDIFDAANIEEAKLVISTSPDFKDNLTLIALLHRQSSKAKIIARAETKKEAQLLYQAGAHYVIFPHLSTGQFLGKHISDHPDLASLNILKKNDLATLAKSG